MKEIKTELSGNGDFRSEECINYLKQADVVVTNPPFSLFREYVAQLMDYNKKFIIIGNQNAITYKEIFPYIKDNQLWLGVSMNGANRWFIAPDKYEVKENAAGYKVENGKQMFFVNGVVWFTNLDNKKRNAPLFLFKKYNSNEYPKYDNYDAIEVSRVENIPIDYEGVMGVPISFLHKYCPTQFEIVDARSIALNEKQIKKNTYLIKDADGAINGKPTYARICIKKNVKFEIVGIDRYIKDNPKYGHRFTIKGKEIYARILIRRKLNIIEGVV